MNTHAAVQTFEHPATNESRIGVAALMRMALSGADLTPLGNTLIEHATHHPDNADTLMDLSTILLLTGHREVALTLQAQALAMQQVYRVRSAPNPTAMRLLAIMAPGDLMANTPLEFLLEDADVTLDALYVAPGLAMPAVLPEHDMIFVAVGESDQNRPLLQYIEGLIASWPWPRPVLNKPARIARLSRDGASTLLKSTSGLVMPQSVRIDRQTLERAGRAELSMSSLVAESDFPIIIRPIGSHAGQGLEKLDQPSAIADYLQNIPEPTFYVTPFVDYRSADGQYRKYRIAVIDGRPWACHMAISDRWMIHYLNAGMSDSAQKRAEEAEFMARFDSDFACRHRAAFDAVTARLGLDYYGIDCAETAAGQLLIFEVDTSMIVHAMDPVDVFPYKQPQMRKVFAAFHALLAKTLQARAL